MPQSNVATGLLIHIRLFRLLIDTVQHPNHHTAKKSPILYFQYLPGPQGCLSRPPEDKEASVQEDQTEVCRQSKLT